jgi:hypothetical protein
MVVASYNRDITLLANLLEKFTPSADLVVYHKHDFNESRDVPNGWHQHALDECLPNESHRPLLSFLQVLPNFGCVTGDRTQDVASEELGYANVPCSILLSTSTTTLTAPNGTHGGSREPFAFLQFLLDFYTRLPDMVLFSQDDTVPSSARF